MDLTCPKCNGTMRTYERNGVHVDQCGDCRGIFLDRGELERLVDAENAWHAGSGSASAAPGHQPPARPGGGGLGAVVGEVLQHARAPRPGQHYPPQGYPQPYGYPRKRKKSFLDELFD